MDEHPVTVKLNANYEPSRDDDEQDCLGGYDFDFGPALVATVPVTTADADIDSSSRKHVIQGGWWWWMLLALAVPAVLMLSVTVAAAGCTAKH